MNHEINIGQSNQISPEVNPVSRQFKGKEVAHFPVREDEYAKGNARVQALYSGQPIHSAESVQNATNYLEAIDSPLRNATLVDYNDKGDGPDR